MSLICHAPSRAAIQASAARSGWVHLCNGLDPRRDGGMVPSILGMTGGLAGQGGAVTIVTPTPSRLDEADVPTGRRCWRARPTTWNRRARGAEVVHLHGLWQGHTRRGASGGATGRRAVPDRGPRHGRALGDAAQGDEEEGVHGARRGQEPATRLLPARALPAGGRPPSARWPRGRRCASCPTGSTWRRSTTCPIAPSWRPSIPSCVGKFVLLFLSRLHVKKGLDLLAEAIRPSPTTGPSCTSLLAGNDDGARRPRSSRRIEAPGLSDRVTFLGHVCGRVGPAGLGGGRRLHPAELQRGVQHGDPGGPGLPPARCRHDRLPLPRTGGGRRGDRRRADRRGVTTGPARPARSLARGAGGPRSSRPGAGRIPLHLGPAGPTAGRGLPMGRRGR